MGLCYGPIIVDIRMPRDTKKGLRDEQTKKGHSHEANLCAGNGFKKKRRRNIAFTSGLLVRMWWGHRVPAGSSMTGRLRKDWMAMNCSGSLVRSDQGSRFEDGSHATYCWFELQCVVCNLCGYDDINFFKLKEG